MTTYWRAQKRQQRQRVGAARRARLAGTCGT
jgi:hypothetical protein